MCGRFALTLDPADLEDAFPEFSFPAQGTRRYNIAPTQPVLALANDGNLRANFFNWGLVPSWAKDPTIGNRMINARAETLAEKPSFRSAYRYRRCIIFTTGFFEWRQVDGQKTKIPYFIHLRSGDPFTFAGLWERWQSPEGSEILSTTIITTTPNQLMASIHNRMPVILPRRDHDHWLDSSPRLPADLDPLLAPYPAEEMEAYPVSTLVNSPLYDRPEVIIKV